MDAKFAAEVDQAAEHRGWWRPYDELPFSAIIEDYVNGACSLDEALRKITEPVNRAHTASDRDQDLPERTFPTVGGLQMEVALSVLHTAKKLDWEKNAQQQERLVELLAAFRNLPDYNPPDLQESWNGVSTGEIKMRDMWNDGPRTDAKYGVVEARAWTNLMAFYVRTIKAGLNDHWLYAIWAFRDALEDDEWCLKHTTQPSEAIQNLDTVLPAACVWILILGDSLYAREEDLRPPSPRHGNPGRGGPAWKKRDGQAEFSKERWAFWKERLAELKDFEGLLPETKDIAARAYAKMLEIEGE